MLGSLLAVVLLIFACAWLAKRVPLSGAGRSHLLALKGSVAVGARERVVLVQAADKVLVLGVAPGRVNTLHVLDQTALDETEGSGPAFAQLMSKDANS